MKIERLSKEHTAQMAAVHAQGFTPGWSVDDFVKYLSNDFDDIWGVIKDRAVQGFVLMRTQSDQAEILTLVVSDQARRQGMAGALLDAAEQAVRDRGAQIVFLDVAKDNAAALTLYQNRKYVRCGTRPGYYRRPHGRVDALLLQKKLK